MPIVTPRNPAILPIQGPDPTASVRQAALIADDIVGDREPIVATGLRREYTPCLFLGFQVTCEQAADLRLLTAVDDENTIDDILQLRSDQQWDDDHLVGALGSVGLSHRFLRDARMQERLEIRAGRFIRKYMATQGGTIEMAVVGQHRITEAIADFLERGLARRDDLASDQIGIDDRDAEFREHIGSD